MRQPSATRTEPSECHLTERKAIDGQARRMTMTKHLTRAATVLALIAVAVAAGVAMTFAWALLATRSSSSSTVRISPRSTTRSR